ncbi:glycoside hydrolase family 3 protein [Asticcacaulis sp. EMRT-3]|uniref:glycoside hydrolase family 3 C-terminal domain-containing protein n=1 Tax=Asticcacaulis sp. EMRT-3 TaxID=3040349 RepID=UPI0024AF2D8C|nr:glycoside hydrolase family 3 protein [Asticcacaulis sp. EMRT-3]MDI7776459.1 glycoside hydrolase family 3 C-terminal domain-containing protein [Asticcacaulis sp. EMRT-3]
MKTSLMMTAASAVMLVCVAGSALAQTPQPWMDKTKTADERAATAVAAMTEDEKLTLVMGYTNPDDLDKQPDSVVPAAIKADVDANDIRGSAGYVPGIARLGIPGQWQTDASMGVRTHGLHGFTALPSSLATAASFDPTVTYAGGVMIAHEARDSGFNTFLAGGANLDREPRNGRNFEYAGEDPWLAGQMAGNLIAGIQSTHMVSTMKHYAVNDQESQRTTVDVTISPEAMHQSDLLAFEFVNEVGHPGSVMCSYNLVNGRWACENEYLLQKVLKHDWGFKGYVMSDWGAVHSTVDAANYGLDQMTGFPCCGDGKAYFGAPLKAALADGDVSQKRLDDMATRILWPLFAEGVIDDPVKVAPIDFKADADVAQHAAEQSLTLLKNDGNLLPLSGVKSIAMIGGHADKGVLSGGGSSAVTPVGGNAVPDLDPKGWPGPVVYMPSSPVTELRADLPKARISYDSGTDIAAAAAAAAKAEVAIVFVTDWKGEGFDTTLDLKDNQDALVAAVVKANPKTIVVLETGGAVFMPWLKDVPAVLEAWYPGIRGGAAIARVLTGAVDPSGHSPISFPADTSQFAHADIQGFGHADGVPVHVTYDEGAAIGYKWYDVKGFTPMFAFGHGLSYTRFAVSDAKASVADDLITVSGTLANTGKVAGKGLVMAFVAPDNWQAAGWEAPKRLGGFSKLDLAPGAQKSFSLTVDPRLLATWEASDNSWHIKAGTYHVRLGQASDALPVTVDVTLTDKVWSAVHSQ